MQNVIDHEKAISTKLVQPQADDQFLDTKQTPLALREEIDEGKSKNENIVMSAFGEMSETFVESEESCDVKIPCEMLTTVSIACPVCKENHKLSVGDASTVADDYGIIDRLERTSVKEWLTKNVFWCALCPTKDDVVKYCSDCGFLCEFCASAHERLSVYKGHSPISCDKLDPETYTGNKRAKNCKQHSLDFVFFCKDCSIPLCPKCLMKGTVDHRPHDYSTLDDSDEVYFERARSLKIASIDMLKNYQCYKDYVQRTEKEFLSSTHSDVLKSAINNQFDSQIETLRRKRRELLQQVEEQSLLAKKSLWAQKDKIDHTITVIESAINFGERVSTLCNPVERIQMHLQVIERLQSVKSDWKPLPVTPPLFLHKPNSSLELTTLADGTISLEVEDLIVCQHSQVIVKFAIPPLSKPHMQILHGKSRQVMDETQVVSYESVDEEDCYNLEFVPRVAGEHVIAIELAGMLLAEKTFEVQGRPRYGNSVQCGPDWKGSLPSEQPGKVTVLRKEERHDMVTVSWGDGEESSHVWGKKGKYEIELLPDN